MKIRSQMYAGFGILLVLIFSIIFISYNNSEKLIKSTDLVLHSQTVTTKIEEIQTLLVDAETGQRGYTITGNEEYLEPYNLAVSDIPTHIKELENLIIEPSQKENLERLEPMIEEKLSNLEKVIELRRDSGLIAAKEVVETGEGKRLMDQIRAVIGEMEDEEARILAERSKRPEEERKLNNQLFVMFLFAGVVLGIVITFVTSRTITRPIKKLTIDVDSITKGNLDIQIEKSKIYEIQTLNESLNRILASLKLAILRTGATKGELGLGEAIKAKKVAEEKVLYFKKAVDASSDAIGMSTPEGKHYYQNKAFEKMFGLTPEEIEKRGGPPKTLYADAKVGAEVFKTIMAGKSWEGEVEMNHLNGPKILVFLRAYAIKDEKGKVVGLVGVHTDITKKRKTEEVIEQREKKFRTLFENVNVGIMLIDKDNLKIIDANPEAAKMLKYNLDELKKLNLKNIWKKGEAKEALAHIYEVLEKKKAIISQRNLICKDRTVIISEVLANLIEIEGKMHIIGSIRDITREKKAEESLKQSELKYKSIAEKGTSMTYTLDTKGNVTYASPNSKRIMGYTPKELIGKSFKQFVLFTELPKGLKIFVDVLRGKEQDFEMNLKRKDGSKIKIKSHTFPIYKDGKVVGAQGNIIEIKNNHNNNKDVVKNRVEIKSVKKQVNNPKTLRPIVNRQTAAQAVKGAVKDFLVPKPIPKKVIKARFPVKKPVKSAAKSAKKEIIRPSLAKKPAKNLKKAEKRYFLKG